MLVVDVVLAIGMQFWNMHCPLLEGCAASLIHLCRELWVSEPRSLRFLLWALMSLAGGVTRPAASINFCVLVWSATEVHLRLLRQDRRHV